MPSDVPQSEAELAAHLEEQLQFLEFSADAYDRGFEGEAKRLAVALRVLFHHYRTSKALLAQLGRLEATRFFDSAFPDLPGNTLTYAGLLVTAHTKQGAKYLPMLDDQQIGPGEWIPFQRWWNGIVFVDNSRRRISRKDLVLSVADQDGGAHVDPGLNATYAALSRSNSIGWSVVKGGKEEPMGPPHLAALRQITHESIKSLRPDYTKKNQPLDALMYSAGAAVFDSAPGPLVLPAFMSPQHHLVTKQPSKNAPCPCGSGKNYKRCHGA